MLAVTKIQIIFTQITIKIIINKAKILKNTKEINESVKRYPHRKSDNLKMI